MVRLASGIGKGSVEPVHTSLLADYYPHEQRGRAFSIQQCLVFVGFGLGIVENGYDETARIAERIATEERAAAAALRSGFERAVEGT